MASEEKILHLIDPYTSLHYKVVDAMVMYFSLTHALVEYYDKNWGDLNTSREYMFRTWLTWRSDKRN